MVVMSFPFEIQDRIDDVLKRFWAGNRPFLCDMSDKKDRSACVLGEKEELTCNLANLRN